MTHHTRPGRQVVQVVQVAPTEVRMPHHSAQQRPHLLLPPHLLPHLLLPHLLLLLHHLLPHLLLPPHLLPHLRRDKCRRLWGLVVQVVQVAAAQVVAAVALVAPRCG